MNRKTWLSFALLVVIPFAAVWAFASARWAVADPPALVDAGAGSGSAVVGPAAVPLGIAAATPSGPCLDADGPGPAPCVSSPLKQPGASLDTAAAAKRVGWPLLVFVVLFFLAVMAGEVIPALKKGRVALFMAGGTTALAAACNAGFDGGSWYAMAAAAGAVLLTMVQGNRSVAEMLKAMQPKAGV